ncbi:MAG TPA: hypothetical protein DCS67_00985 [Clostridiales bacterium UBA8960]|jgi:succinate dehydrogenase/fumarate reductase cytochrome b subunit|nr:hypothetical protein [Clostridiales bacterium UBA8960]
MEFREVNNTSESGVVTVKEWIITMLILMIPLVNIVMVFVWAFGGGANASKANYFKAMLIIWLVGIVLWFLVVGTFLMPVFRSMTY